MKPQQEREQQQCQTRAWQPWAKAETGEGRHGPETDCTPQPQRSMLAEASVFRGSHLPAHRLRCSSCFPHYWEQKWWRLAWQEKVPLVPRPPVSGLTDQILRTTEDQEGVSFLKYAARRTHKLHPAFLLAAIKPAPGNDIRRWGPTDSQQSWAAEPFPTVSALLTLSALCLPDETRPPRKEWGKRKELRQDPSHRSPRPVLSRSLLSHFPCPQLSSAFHSHYTVARGHSESCLLLQNPEHEPAPGAWNPRPGCSALFSVLRSVRGLPSPTPKGQGTSCSQPMASSTMKVSKLTVVNEPSDQKW